MADIGFIFDAIHAGRSEAVNETNKVTVVTSK
jgi:hypothetical protein